MFNIKIAGLNVGIDNQYEYVRRLCEDYITEDANTNFTVSVSEEEILEEKSNFAGASCGYCESICVYRQICLKMTEYNGFVLHGAALAVDGETYVFLAKSGVGKTTRMKCLTEKFGDRAEVINGDKPIIRRVGKKWYACGTPWCGKENYGNNLIMPLKALCFIERSTENTLKRVLPEQITEKILQQILMPKDNLSLTMFFALLGDLLQKHPLWLLRCGMECSVVVKTCEGMFRGD